MPGCHEMRKGEVYLCEDCGMELQVIKECKEVGTPQESCTCHPGDIPCTISCCDKPLTKKQP
jgi:hypothetical protein